MLKNLTHTGNSWFLLDKEYALKVLPYILGEPGVRIKEISENNYRIQVHYTHLPLLPGISELPEVLGDPPVEFNEYRDPSNEWFDELWDHQRSVGDLLAQRHGSLCALDLGGGKSRTAITAGLAPYLVVCPKSASSVWEDEFDHAGLRWHTLQGKPPGKFSEVKQYFQDHGPIEAWILNYHIAKNWLPYFCPGGAAPATHTVIVDEAHYLQKDKLQWYEALGRVGRMQTIALTATPMRNRLRSLWGLLNAVAPSAWGSQYEFRQVYCGATPGEYGLEDGTPSDEAVTRLRKRLRAVLVKMTRADIKQDLPSITRELWAPDIPRGEVVDLIRGAAEDVYERDRQGAHLAWDTEVRKKLGQLKVPYVVEKTLELLPKWRKAVLWVWHDVVARELATRFKEAGVQASTIVGRTQQKVRDRLAREWKIGDPRPDKPEVLIASVGAASSAVSFITSGLCIFVEQDWAPLNIQQAEARTHRYGQMHPECLAVYCIIPGTLDERIGKALVDKSEEAERVLGSDGQVAQMKTMLGEHEENIDDFMRRRAQSLLDE